ncbi:MULTISPECIES: hypothetical protein [Fusobacterium]|jgi:hypothetical protein|uniref:Uncharacterized protein n=1 Tax=Fusobacterium hominis TaxID=2764326 RepID=A0A7G9GXD9_9FUSO|nr:MULTISPECIES: hypothetical protein [Fusobacterium]QNM15471.1 hypothetical protein H9Q81_01125 [Fusobacterium hominis]
MSERLSALGLYLVEQTGKNFNFKVIKSDPIYYNILFSVGSDDYLVSDDIQELNATIELMSHRLAHKDYPPKQVKKYTHRKFEKIHKKKQINFTSKGTRFIIIKL